MLARSIFTFGCILSLLVGFTQSSPEELFQQANDAYDQQQYDSSLVLYQLIEEQEMVSAELYQNMGTAAYKLNLVPDAIYYFEKGLKLNPGNDDLEHNLKMAHKRLTDKSGASFSTGITGWLSSTLGGSADFWSVLAVVGAIVGALLLLGYAFLSSRLIKRIGLIGGIVSWVFTVLFVMVAFLQYNVANNNDFAILFEPSIEVRNDPSKAASIAFVLHEGSKLKILDENENWYKVHFDQGKVGWLPKTSVKII